MYTSNLKLWYKYQKMKIDIKDSWSLISDQMA